MFAPLKVWRKWHRTSNRNQKRHAVASALAASAVAPLVLARGHHVNHVPELPLVVDSLNVDSTKALLAALDTVGVSEDLRRVRASKSSRAGFNKMRYSRFTFAKGPLIVYGQENPNLKRTARNLPGIDTCHVSRLNLLQLAPGGHLGRFVIFTQDAFVHLNKVFGTYREKGIEKSGYQLNRNMMACADLARIINSDQVQAKLRAVKHNSLVKRSTKKNPLKNKTLMQRLNPASKVWKAAAAKNQEQAKKDRLAKLKAKHSKAGRKEKAVRSKRFQELHAGLEKSFQVADSIIKQEIADGLYDPEFQY
jgi:large subunit ribosomal protein L4e